MILGVVGDGLALHGLNNLQGDLVSGRGGGEPELATTGYQREATLGWGGRHYGRNGGAADFEPKTEGVASLVTHAHERDVVVESLRSVGEPDRGIIGLTEDCENMKMLLG